jgi:hypothetical protein
MPKVSDRSLEARIRRRISQLKNGDEVPVKDIRSLLSADQVAKMDVAWKAQQVLRKKKRARTREQEIEFGWKSKRDIQIESLERALLEIDWGSILEKEAASFAARKARVWMKAWSAAYADLIEKGYRRGSEELSNIARDAADRAITVSGLQSAGLEEQRWKRHVARDKEISDLERQILDSASEKMTESERQEYEARFGVRLRRRQRSGTNAGGAVGVREVTRMRKSRKVKR